MINVVVQSRSGGAFTTAAITDKLRVRGENAVNISLNLSTGDVAFYQAQGDDLILTLANGETVTIMGFYDADGPVKNRLFLSEDGDLIQAVLPQLNQTALLDGLVSDVAVTNANAPLVFEGSAALGTAALGGTGGGLSSGALIAGGALGLLALAGAAGGGGGDTTPNPDPPVAPQINDSNGRQISGRGQPGSEIGIDTDGDGTADVTTTVGPDGSWTVAFTPELPDGTAFAATQTDEAGNESPQATGLIDSVAPAAPTITGIPAGDAITGTGEPGAQIKIDVDGDGIPEATTIVDANGNWTATPSPALPEDTDFTVTQTDAAGNESSGANGTIDTVAPDAPIVGVATAGEISGYAEPGATVTITDGTTEFIAVANISGNWTFDPQPDYAPNTELTATATDAAGNQSAPEIVSTAGELVVNGDFSATPQANDDPSGWTVTEATPFGVDSSGLSARFNASEETANGILEQTVTVQEGVPVDFSFDYSESGSNTNSDMRLLVEIVDADGDVVFSQISDGPDTETVSTSFVTASDSYTIRFTDQSPDTGGRDVNIDNVSFVQQGGSNIAPPVVENFASGELSGTGHVGATINVDVNSDGSVDATTTVGADGTWTIALATDVAADENVSVTQIDQADNESAAAIISPEVVTTSFAFNGGDQFFTLPDGATEVTVQSWGAAGSGRAVGGGGGYTQATFEALDLPDTLLVVVGEGGEAASDDTQANGGYGGGGSSGIVDAGGNTTGGAGGGLSGVFNAASFATATQADALAIAGGGGGDRYGGGFLTGSAGAGGGASGETVSDGGGAGTSTAAGVGGSAVASDDASGGTDVRSGDAGSSFQGGDGANGFNLHSAGGGGGGYFGGGGGGIGGTLGNGDDLEGAGGGGSGFVSDLATAATTTTGTGQNTPSSGDVNYIAGVGAHQNTDGDTQVSGMPNYANDDGGDGLVVLTVTQSRTGFTNAGPATSQTTAQINDDTVALDGGEVSLDLDALGDRDVGNVDIAGTGANNLTISLEDVLSVTGDHNTLHIFGDSDDTVTQTGFAPTGKTVSDNGVTFDEFTGGAATLLIEDDLAGTGV